MILAFDLDGTLCEPRQAVSDQTCDLIHTVSQRYHTWIVTGATYEDVVRQRAADVCNTIFTENASACYAQGQMHWNTHTQISWRVAQFIHNAFPDFHVVEQRFGLAVNTGIADVNARRERCEQLERVFPFIQATVSGRTSICVMPQGAGKHRALEHAEEPVWWFADQCWPRGNDWSMAVRCKRYTQVPSPNHLNEYLKEIL